MNAALFVLLLEVERDPLTVLPLTFASMTAN